MRKYRELSEVRTLQARHRLRLYLAVDGQRKSRRHGSMVAAAQRVAHLVGQELQLGAHVGQGVEEDAVLFVYTRGGVGVRVRR